MPWLTDFVYIILVTLALSTISLISFVKLAHLNSRIWIDVISHQAHCYWSNFAPVRTHLPARNEPISQTMGEQWPSTISEDMLIFIPLVESGDCAHSDRMLASPPSSYTLRLVIHTFIQIKGCMSPHINLPYPHDLFRQHVIKHLLLLCSLINSSLTHTQLHDGGRLWFNIRIYILFSVSFLFCSIANFVESRRGLWLSKPTLVHIGDCLWYSPQKIIHAKVARE